MQNLTDLNNFDIEIQKIIDCTKNGDSNDDQEYSSGDFIERNTLDSNFKMLEIRRNPSKIYVNS